MMGMASASVASVENRGDGDMGRGSGAGEKSKMSASSTVMGSGSRVAEDSASRSDVSRKRAMPLGWLAAVEGARLYPGGWISERNSSQGGLGRWEKIERPRWSGA